MTETSNGRAGRDATKAADTSPLPGTHPRKKRRPGFVWELIGCAQHGHALVGTTAASVAGDPHLAREMDGIRWHRCLRCDAWLPVAPPDKPARDRLPDRDDVELPLRGRPLRDRYVLRIIAVDRAIHFVLLAVVFLALLLLAIHHTRYQADVTRLINDFQSGAGGPQGDTGHGLLGEFHKLTSLSTFQLYELAGAVAVYGVLEGLEAIGLWWGKRWAEYLTFLATILLLPLEIYELTEKMSWFKVVALVVNVGIAIYLLVAKRLFGIRGGGAHEAAVRAYDSGWEAVERRSPEVFAMAAAEYAPEYHETNRRDAEE